MIILILILIIIIFWKLHVKKIENSIQETSFLMEKVIDLSELKFTWQNLICMGLSKIC